LAGWEVQASVSPTPSVADPGVISTDCCRLAVRNHGPDVVGSNVGRRPARKSSEVYFFFFAATLLFAGALFFAAVVVFAFAFFTM